VVFDRLNADAPLSVEIARNGANCKLFVERE
jgi:hypothetical protein